MLSCLGVAELNMLVIACAQKLVLCKRVPATLHAHKPCNVSLLLHFLQVIWMQSCGYASTNSATRAAPAHSRARAAAHQQQRRLRVIAWLLVMWHLQWSFCCWLGSWTRPLMWLLLKAQWMCLRSWWQTMQQ
jgi:hypothetical protein